MDEFAEISGQRAVKLALSGSVASTSPLVKGTYHILSDVDCSIVVERGAASPALTLDSGYPIQADIKSAVRVGDNQIIHAIAGGAGNLIAFRVGN